MDLTNNIFYSTILVIVLFVIKPTHPQLIQAPDELCLQCICELASECNLAVGCIRRSQVLCGPFYISKPYWDDAKKPLLFLDHVNDPGAFPRCVNDPTCAAKTVKGYMEVYGEDCNHDKNIDCFDYAILHFLGQLSCKLNMTLHASKLDKFRKCLKCT